MYFQIDKNKLAFPHPKYADEDGLLAVGGDLSTDRLLLAYEHGIFPWFSEENPILWYAPHQRFVLYPEEFKLSKSLKQFMRNSGFTVKQNTAFQETIANCAAIPRTGQDGTWITDAMQEAYIALHKLGYAHSVETYDQYGELVGGLYGIQIGSVFCGESMFAKTANASKMAFAYLCAKPNIQLIDCQIHSAHLASLGGRLIPSEQFLALLEKQSTLAHAF